MAGENWGSDSVSDGSSRRDIGVWGAGASVSGSLVSGSPVSVPPASAPLTSPPCEIRALLVLDEIMAAVNSGFVANESLLAALDHRPDDLEVVLTGRGPSEELLSRADYVTEMRAVKHPYEKGVGARKGVEY